ncbi:MAG TPA: redoxin domain-containing protein [Polyangia bacterium]|jgi:thiol-disulfide isomerase/thioredoxin|nr:redoxin domain-containing protein [Polyangia bacterium]
MRRTRLFVLLTVLGLSLAALAERTALQVWASGAGDGVRTLGGTLAPPLPADTRTLDGKPLTLAALRGRVVLLHFWTFGCSSCAHMLPHYSEWDAKLRARGLSIVGVHTPELDFERDQAALRRFVALERLAWPIVVDADEAIWTRYHVAAWPTVVLIDRRGFVRDTFVGDDRAPAIEAALGELLAAD